MLKVSIYQRPLDLPLDEAGFKKLASLKSDFLVLPEQFYANGGAANAPDLRASGDAALQWLLRLNTAYRGVIIGGSLAHEEGGKIYNAAPVVSDGNLIDWYRKRDVSSDPKGFAAGSEPGVFILAGHRFAVLLGQDLFREEFLRELAAMEIRTILAPMSLPETDSDRFEGIQAAAREFGLFIACTCGTGSLLGQRVLGRSMMVTPQGVSWRVSSQEEAQEILKTVVINVPA